LVAALATNAGVNLALKKWSPGSRRGSPPGHHSHRMCPETPGNKRKREISMGLGLVKGPVELRKRTEAIRSLKHATQNQVVETSCWFESGQGHHTVVRSHSLSLGCSLKIDGCALLTVAEAPRVALT